MPIKPLEPEVENIHGMNKAQWRKWPRASKMAFNSVKSFLLENQELTCHPDAAPIPEKHWHTIAHNAAFMAADIARDRYWGKTGDKDEDAAPPEITIGDTPVPAVGADA